MKPVDFSQANRTLAKPEIMTDEECGSLPVWSDNMQCVSLWKLNWRERLSVLLFGNVWLTVVAGESQPPVSLQAQRTIFTNYYHDGVASDAEAENYS